MKMYCFGAKTDQKDEHLPTEIIKKNICSCDFNCIINWFIALLSLRILKFSVIRCGFVGGGFLFWTNVSPLLEITVSHSP